MDIPPQASLSETENPARKKPLSFYNKHPAESLRHIRIQAFLNPDLDPGY